MRRRSREIEAAIRTAAPEWSLREVAAALQAFRGIDLIHAVTLMAEIGDLTRFADAQALMDYLGVIAEHAKHDVPREESTGDRVERGGITKAGNSRARTALVEASWNYRHPPRVGREKQAKVDAAPEAARAIAWKAQTRLTARFRHLTRKNKRPVVVATAVARELAGFVWAIGQAAPSPSAGAR